MDDRVGETDQESHEHEHNKRNTIRERNEVMPGHFDNVRWQEPALSVFSFSEIVADLRN
jgi:hypothetical protein